jgi:hypothetical protein
VQLEYNEDNDARWDCPPVLGFSLHAPLDRLWCM